MSDEVKKEYIFYPDHKDKGIRSVSRDNAKVATLNEKRNKLIMYDLQGNKKSIEINERTSTGTRVCATNEAAFIMGGED